MPLAGKNLFRGIIAAIIACVLVCGSASIGWGQEIQGSDDLDQALMQKIKAQTTRDLDAVVKLCKSAIEKGLDEEGKVQAQQLAASALFEHADQLSQRIFSPQRDARWQQYRSEALSRLSQAVEYQPDLTAAYLMTARLNMLPNGDRNAAEKAIEKAVEFAGEDREQLSNALFLRASLTEDNTAQISDLNQAIKINPNNTEAMRVRALFYLSNDEPDKALIDLNKLLESDENTTQNYLDTVGLLMSTGPKFDEKMQAEAIKILDKAIEQDAETAASYFLRAELNVLQEKLDEALADSSKAIELDSKNRPSQRNLSFLTQRASIYLDQEKYDKALDDVKAALDIEPDLARGILLRGMILLQQGDYAGAIEDIKLLSDSSPDNPALKRQLAMLYNTNDQPSKAIYIYDGLIEEFAEEKFEKKSEAVQRAAMSERSAALRGRGDARLSTGEHAEAVNDYDQAWKLSEELRQLQEQETDIPIPADDGILNNLAWVLATSPNDKIRDGKRAIELATLAAEATEFKQAHILSTLASGYAETGDFENAIKWIEKAIEVNREESEKTPSKHNLTQQESLQKEYESYKKKEPWRELQNVEQEKKEVEDDKHDPAPAADKKEDPEQDSDEEKQDKGSDDKGSDDKGSDDKGSDDKGSDDKGSDDKGSDDKELTDDSEAESDEDKSDKGKSDEGESDDNQSDEDKSDDNNSDGDKS